MKKSRLNVPTLSEASPIFDGLLAKRLSLSQQQAALSEKIKAALAAVAQSAGSMVRDARDLRASQILGEGFEPDGEPNSKELANLQERKVDLDRALDILNIRINRERTVASRTICQKVKPEYDSRVRAICDAMLQLHSVVNDYEGLKNAILANDVAFTAGVIPMGTDKVMSHINAYLVEAMRDGFIERSALSDKILESAGYMAKASPYA